jgi:RNA polymerase sigma-70 factor, ECF subfamily
MPMSDSWLMVRYQGVGIRSEVPDLAHVGAIPVDAGARADDSDDVLVAAALADRSQFAAIYERYRLPVYRYMRAQGVDEDDATEHTAETFERAFRSLGRYRPRGGGLAAWLFRIARNAHIDERRRTSRIAVLDDRAREIRATDDADLAIDLRRLVAGLPAPTRDAIALRYAAGLTAREIGEVIGKRSDAVQKVIERGLDTIREGLRDDA